MSFTFRYSLSTPLHSFCLAGMTICTIDPRQKRNLRREKKVAPSGLLQQGKTPNNAFCNPFSCSFSLSLLAKKKEKGRKTLNELYSSFTNVCCRLSPLYLSQPYATCAAGSPGAMKLVSGLRVAFAAEQRAMVGELSILETAFKLAPAHAFLKMTRPGGFCYV